MFAQLPTLQKLIRQLQRVPYLASKNVYKVAMYLLTSDQKAIEQLCSTILEAKQQIRHCTVCFNWTETGDLCGICMADKRDKTVL
jgi:recombination protein RecR